MFLLFLIASITALHFPYSVGPPSGQETIDEASEYYQSIYTPVENGEDHSYVRFGQEVAHRQKVSEGVAEFIARYGLEDAKVLEVGAGSGTLQDLAEDYTGLDIAASAARFFHKPFVEGSATNLPFEDNSFDVVWTIWTLEHVPDPELALEEIRRVLRDGGYLYLLPAWNNPTWASQPFLDVPMEQIRLRDKLKMIFYMVQQNHYYYLAHVPATRLLRVAVSKIAPPTRLRYHEMTPNYGAYHRADADAVNSIDCLEARLWFESRGDNVLEADSPWRHLEDYCSPPVVIQVSKPEVELSL